MKILYLHQHFTVRNGSSGTRSYEFARLLYDKGHNVTIISGQHDRSGLSQPGMPSKTHDFENVRVIELSVPYSQNMNYVRRAVAFVWFSMRATWAAIWQKDADVILATSTPLTIAIPAMIASLIKRRPFVFEVRDLWPEAPVRLGILRNRLVVAAARGLERLVYRRARHIVALSPGIKEGIMHTGIAPEKITIIPNACDNELFDVPASAGKTFRARHPYLDGKRLVVYVGALGYGNGLDYLLRVADHTRRLDNHIAFLLVGSGSQSEILREQARKLEVLDSTVWLLGPVPRQEVPAILSASDLATSIFLPNPVMQLNSPNKFFDAMAAGRPIAVNHLGWLAEMVQASGAGIVLPPEDPAGAAQLLTHFLHDELRVEQAGQAARQLACKRFDRRTLVDQLEDVLEQTVSAGY